MEFPEELEGRFHDAVLVKDKSRFLFYKAWMYHPRGRGEKKDVLIKVPSLRDDLDGAGTQTPLDVQAALQARLVHPNIARLYSFSLKPYPYVAMEFVEGRSLEECASEIPHDICEEMVVGLVSALVYMHDKGVHHGDVCPENVFVPSYAGLAKLVDFGNSEDISPGKISPAQAYCKKTDDLFSLVALCSSVFAENGMRFPSSFPEVIVPRILASQNVRR